MKKIIRLLLILNLSILLTGCGNSLGEIYHSDNYEDKETFIRLNKNNVDFPDCPKEGKLKCSYSTKGDTINFKVEGYTLWDNNANNLILLANSAGGISELWYLDKQECEFMSRGLNEDVDYLSTYCKEVNENYEATIVKDGLIYKDHFFKKIK